MQISHSWIIIWPIDVSSMCCQLLMANRQITLRVMQNNPPCVRLVPVSPRSGANIALLKFSLVGFSVGICPGCQCHVYASFLSPKFAIQCRCEKNTRLGVLSWGRSSQLDIQTWRKKCAVLSIFEIWARGRGTIALPYWPGAYSHGRGVSNRRKRHLP